MKKYDYKKDFKPFYLPVIKGYHLVDVPSMNFLMIDGSGNPNTSIDYQDSLEVLYGMAYTIKFAMKAKEIEFVVPPLQGLWWSEDMQAFILEHKDNWLWTMMIMMPDEVSQEIFDQGLEKLSKKKPNPFLEKLYLSGYAEGRAAQIIYTGAYADEGPTILGLHAFIHQQGYELTGKHHEIYLGDPRRTPPEKLKTVIRQPVSR